MGSLASQQAFDRGVEQMLRIQRAEPSLVVCDLHPGYATTALAERLAERFDVDVMPVQHHYAHALSLLTEHGVDEGPVVVGAFDGTGYGLDGTIWGGEILTIAEDYSWSRTWHVSSFPLVGGDRAVHHPWRIAAGISHAWDLNIPLPDSQEAALVASQLESGFGVVQSSSLGRLFDAASWLLTGITPTFEAHAAMHLEYVASRVDHARGTTSAATSFPDLFMELLSPGDISERALRFHHGVARPRGCAAPSCAVTSRRRGSRNPHHWRHRRVRTESTPDAVSSRRVGELPLTYSPPCTRQRRRAEPGTGGSRASLRFQPVTLAIVRGCEAPG